MKTNPTVWKDITSMRNKNPTDNSHIDNFSAKTAVHPREAGLVRTLTSQPPFLPLQTWVNNST